MRNFLFITTASLAAVGCGSAVEGPPREAIAGKITLDGKPVKKGFITFVPVAGSPELTVSALVIDGEYTLTREAGPTRGLHRVDITARELTGKQIKDRNDPDNPILVSRELIPAEYNRNSRLTADVKPDVDNLFNFELVGVKVAMRPRR